MVSLRIEHTVLQTDQAHSLPFQQHSHASTVEVVTVPLGSVRRSPWLADREEAAEVAKVPLGLILRVKPGYLQTR